MEKFLMASYVKETLEKFIKLYGDCPILISDSESPNSICNPTNLVAIKVKPEGEIKEDGDIAFLFTDFVIQKGDSIEL